GGAGGPPGSLASGPPPPPLPPSLHRLPSSLVASLLAPQSRRHRAPSARSRLARRGHPAGQRGRRAGQGPGEPGHIRALVRARILGGAGARRGEREPERHAAPRDQARDGPLPRPPARARAAARAGQGSGAPRPPRPTARHDTMGAATAQAPPGGRPPGPSRSPVWAAGGRPPQPPPPNSAVSAWGGRPPQPPPPRS